MAERTLDIGIAGVSGAVGTDLIRLMRGADFPVGELKLFGSRNSAGNVHEYGGRQHVVRPFRPEALVGLDFLVTATPAAASVDLARAAIDAGVFVLDASAAFRADDDVPLVVPAVNRAALADSSGVVASPGAVGVALSLVLAPFVEGPGVAAVDAVVLLSVSSGGRAGMNEMSRQVISILNQKPFDIDVFPNQVAFNLTPWVGAASDRQDGASGEERSTVAELRRLLPGLPDAVGVTAALVPTFVGHSVSLTLRLDQALSAAEARALLAGAGGLDLHGDDDDEGGVPSSVDAAERDDVLVSRVRVDAADPAVVRLWLAFDNLRTGARNLLVTMGAILEEGLV